MKHYMSGHELNLILCLGFVLIVISLIIGEKHDQNKKTNNTQSATRSEQTHKS